MFATSFAVHSYMSQPLALVALSSVDRFWGLYSYFHWSFEVRGLRGVLYSLFWDGIYGGELPLSSLACQLSSSPDEYFDFFFFFRNLFWIHRGCRSCFQLCNPIMVSFPPRSNFFIFSRRMTLFLNRILAAFLKPSNSDHGAPCWTSFCSMTSQFFPYSWRNVAQSKTADVQWYIIGVTSFYCLLYCICIVSSNELELAKLTRPQRLELLLIYCWGCGWIWWSSTEVATPVPSPRSSLVVFRFWTASSRKEVVFCIFLRRPDYLHGSSNSGPVLLYFYDQTRSFSWHSVSLCPHFWHRWHCTNHFLPSLQL